MTNKLLKTPVSNIVYIPTAQQDEVNPWEPNARGISRIKVAEQCLAANPDAVLVIGGGRPNHRGATYSDRTASYIDRHHPSMLDRLVLICGNYHRTIGDVFQGALLLASLYEEQGVPFAPANITFSFCSEEIHYSRTVATIETMGFNPVHIESGADSSIYSKADLQMAEQVITGKLLGLGPQAVEWEQAALQNVKIDAAVSQEWANANPQLDEERYANMQALLLRLSANGVYIESPTFQPTRPRPAIPTYILS